jgi:hypothetical protein
MLRLLARVLVDFQNERKFSQWGRRGMHLLFQHPIAPRLAQIADLVILHQMNRPFARYAADFYNMKNLIVDRRSIAHLISNLSERLFELKGFNIADFVVLNRLHQPIESWST